MKVIGTCLMVVLASSLMAIDLDEKEGGSSPLPDVMDSSTLAIPLGVWRSGERTRAILGEATQKGLLKGVLLEDSGKGGAWKPLRAFDMTSIRSGPVFLFHGDFLLGAKYTYKEGLEVYRITLDSDPETVKVPLPGGVRFDEDVVPVLVRHGDSFFLIMAKRGDPPRLDAFLLRSDDEGKTWETVSVPESAAIREDEVRLLLASAGNTLYLGANEGDSDQKLELFRSKDNGASWEKMPGVIEAPLERIYPLVMDVKGEDVVVAFASKGKDPTTEERHLFLYVVHSSSGGEKWSAPVKVGEWHNSTKYPYVQNLAIRGSKVYLGWVEFGKSEGRYPKYQYHLLKSEDLGKEWVSYGQNDESWPKISFGNFFASDDGGKVCNILVSLDVSEKGFASKVRYREIGAGEFLEAEGK